MKINWNNRPIVSYSIKELIDNAEPEYLKKGQRAAKLKDPQILRAMANTLILRTKSSEFDTNSTYWHQYLMFEDFVTIAKDRDIPLRDAVAYAIEDGDVKIQCDCPSHLYWGWKYISTQLGYNYGNYRENRRPTRNNTELRSTSCKHIYAAFLWLLDHIDDVTEWFSIYYQREVATDTEQVEGVVSVSDVAVDDVVAETVETDIGPVTEVGTASAGVNTDADLVDLETLGEADPVDLDTLDEPDSEPSDESSSPDALETLDELDEWLGDYPEIDNFDEEEF